MDNSLHWLDPIVINQPQISIGFNSTDDENMAHNPILLQLKSEIDDIHPIQIWDDAKKITNPYEYIFLSLQKRMHRSVAAINPLSRSYFKMIELWTGLGLSSVRATAHSAEGPGGFLEAIMDRSADPVRMIAMTLRASERTIPGWRKSSQFLNAYPSVHITYGADNTGNLYSLANQDAFAEVARDHLGEQPTLYTADGGFDFSADFNAQENTVLRLLAAEALCGLNVLAAGGTMILKIFDTTHRATLELLWMISSCFERTALMKPSTSRPANSERYWIGSQRIRVPDWILSTLRELTAQDGWTRIFVEPIYDTNWLNQLQQFQEEIETQQINNIQMTLNLIKQPAKIRVAELLLDNIKASRSWCTRYGVQLNRHYRNMSDEQITALNLEEALEPFQASVARTNLLALSRPSLTRHVSTSAPSQRPPAVLAWRSTLPASIRGPGPSQTVSDTALPSDLTLPESLPEACP